MDELAGEPKARAGVGKVRAGAKTVADGVFSQPLIQAGEGVLGFGDREEENCCAGRNLPVARSWPLRIMCMSSMPAIVAAADRNDLNPSIGRTTRLTARWSCSTMLFRYLILRISMSAAFSALKLSSAAVLAPLLSIVIFSGTPCWPVALHRNRNAALRSRLAVSRKSTVPPVLSTARYKYFQQPLTFTYVSSIRQLEPT